VSAHNVNDILKDVSAAAFAVLGAVVVPPRSRTG
jgi:hypothetical protein